MVLIKILFFLMLSSGIALILAIPINFSLYWVLESLRIPSRFLRDFLNITDQPEIAINYFSLVPALLLASFIMTFSVERRPFSTLGISLHPGWLRKVNQGILLATVLMLPLLIVVHRFAPYNPITSPSAIQDFRNFLTEAPLVAGLYSVMIFLGVVFEEPLFRGYLFQTLLSGLGRWPTVLVTSVIFALSHYQTHMMSGMAYAGFFGFLMAMLYLSSKSLWVCVGMHFAANWIHFFALLVFQDVPLQPGENWPLVGTTGVITLILATWALMYLKPSTEMETLWQQYVPIAQPWAQLKSWWAKRRGQHPKDAS